MSVTDILNQLTPDGAHLTPAPVRLGGIGGEFNSTCDRVLKCPPSLFFTPTSRVGRVRRLRGPAPQVMGLEGRISREAKSETGVYSGL